MAKVNGPLLFSLKSEVCPQPITNEQMTGEGKGSYKPTSTCCVPVTLQTHLNLLCSSYTLQTHLNLLCSSYTLQTHLNLLCSEVELVYDMRYQCCIYDHLYVPVPQLCQVYQRPHHVIGHLQQHRQLTYSSSTDNRVRRQSGFPTFISCQRQDANVLPKRRQSHQGDKLCDVSTVPLVARWPVFLARGSDADGEPH